MNYCLQGILILLYIFSIHIEKIEKWERTDRVGPMARALNDNIIDISGNPLVLNTARLPMAKFIYPSWPFQ